MPHPTRLPLVTNAPITCSRTSHSVSRVPRDLYRPGLPFGELSWPLPLPLAIPGRRPRAHPVAVAEVSCVTIYKGTPDYTSLY